MVSYPPTGVRIPAGEAAAYGPVGRAPWLDVDWRAQQRWVEVEGRPVNTVDMGSGPPLVLVHGLSGSWPNWLEQIPVFAASHRVIALDLPGFGHSPMPRDDISISGYARILDGLLDKLGIGPAVFVGNSMGGFISAELAIAFPPRVERLVLVSAAGLSTHQEWRAELAMPGLRRAERILAASTAWFATRSDALMRRPRIREAALRLVVRHPSHLPSYLVAEQVRGAGKPGFAEALAATIGYDLHDRFGEIACPTLIVWGENDWLISVGDADVFAELIPNSRRVIFEDTGHMAMLERPAAFNALLREFLAE